MKIVSCSSLAVAIIKFTIGKIRKEGKYLNLMESIDAGAGDFNAYVPKSLEGKLNTGDTIVIACIVSSGVSSTSEVLAIDKLTSETSATCIYDRNGYHNLISDHFSK